MTSAALSKMLATQRNLAKRMAVEAVGVVAMNGRYTKPIGVRP
jgi:hypothetical protein